MTIIKWILKSTKKDSDRSWVVTNFNNTLDDLQTMLNWLKLIKVSTK